MLFRGEHQKSGRDWLLEKLGNASEKEELAGVLVLQETRPRSHQLLGRRPSGAFESTEF